MNSSRPFAHLGSKSEVKSDSVGTPAAKKKKSDMCKHFHSHLFFKILCHCVKTNFSSNFSAPHTSSKDNGLMSPPHWNSGPTSLSSNGDKAERRLSKDGDSASQKKDGGDGSKSVSKVHLISEEDLPDGVGLLPPSTPGRDSHRGPIMSPPHSIPQHSVLRSPFHVCAYYIRIFWVFPSFLFP